ncbi:SAM-dependent methyltransferase [Methanoregula sp.]|uniref:SAM-dependent methyltransferase n=1 Tax=Methanoregula sp. TaxID=2052170 RepID=UPI0035618F43
MNGDLGFIGISRENPEAVPSIGAGPSKTAETTTLVRSGESMKPADIRLFFDPYAIRFIKPALLAWFNAHPDETREIVEYEERRFPGMNSAIVARTRYFDDIISESLETGVEQLVIMGAGFDARAHRISGLSSGVRVFELDQPDTQAVKQLRVREIFGHLPSHVSYVPADLKTAVWQETLIDHGYDPGKKSLFVLEGLCMYLSPETVDTILGFVVSRAGPGSSVLFDYPAMSLIDGSDDSLIAKNFRQRVNGLGEPLRFGIPDGSVVAFLHRRGFSRVRNLTPPEGNARYFHGKNADRPMCSLFSFVHADIPMKGKNCKYGGELPVCRKGLL